MYNDNIIQKLVLPSTRDIIIKKEAELSRFLREEMPEILNDTYNTGGYWHDNYQWEQALRDQQKAKAEQIALNALKDTLIIADANRVETSEVSLYTRVSLKNVSSEIVSNYNLVSPNDKIYGLPEENNVSVLAPMAAPLLGKHIGEIISIQLPKSVMIVEIIEIERFPLD